MLEISDLSRRYPRADRWAVRQVTLTLTPGVTGLLGTNGAGKSTLLRTVIGVDRPTEGSVRWEGVDLSAPGALRALHATLGYLPQHFTFDGGSRCVDVLGYLAWLKEIPRAEAEGDVRRVLEVVGLTDSARTRVKALSGGMRQRLGLAQALLGRPRLLVLDEPTVGLDPRQRQQVRAVLDAVAAEAVVLFSTHLVEEVASLGGRAVVMADGRAPFCGSVAELAALGGGAADSVGALERGLLSFFDGAER